MTDVAKVKLIEDYYTGTLSHAQQEEFNSLLRTDAQFKKDVHAYKKIFGGFRALQADHFKATLERFEREHETPAQTQQRPKGAVRSLQSWWYAAAAAVVLLIGVTVVFQNLSPNLFDQNFMASESIAVHISSTRAGEEGLSEVEQIKKSAYRAYRKADYTEAITLLKDYRNNFPELFELDYQAMVVLGVAQLAQGQAEQALVSFEHVISSRDSSFRQEAEWMTALAYLKLDKIDLAKREISTIARKKEHLYQEKAIQLLEKLS